MRVHTFQIKLLCCFFSDNKEPLVCFTCRYSRCSVQMLQQNSEGFGSGSEVL